MLGASVVIHDIYLPRAAAGGSKGDKSSVKRPARVLIISGVVRKFSELVALYIQLRKISRAEYKKSSEYRRHVTMTAITDSGIVCINLDVIKEYYDRTTDYLNYVENFINPPKE